MSNITPRPEKESEDALTRAVMGMISKGETHKVLAGYDVSVTLTVEPRFIDKVKEGGR